jgi:hypothetical protein
LLHNSRCQTDGFSSSLSRTFKSRNAAAQFLQDNCDSGLGRVHAYRIHEAGWIDYDVVDITNDDSNEDDNKNKDSLTDGVVNNNDDVIDLTGNNDFEPPPRRILSSSTQPRILRPSLHLECCRSCRKCGMPLERQS